MYRGDLIARFVMVGAAVAGLIGGVAGLVVGIKANPRTAWFAIFELGLPAAFVGAAFGLICGTLAYLALRIAKARSGRSRRASADGK